MSWLNNYKDRVTYKGNNLWERKPNEQREQYYRYLHESPNRETIQFQEQEFDVVILSKRTKEDAKYFQILASLELGLKQGSLIYWNDDWWITILEEEQRRDTHFKGALLKCNNELRWVDRFGIERRIHAYIDGNTRGDLRRHTTDSGFGRIASFIFADMTADMRIIIPRTEFTSNLREEDTFLLNDRKWEIVDRDDFSYEGLIGLLVKRVSVSDQKDDRQNGLANASRLGRYRLEVKTGLAYHTHPGVSVPIVLAIYRNNNLVKTNIPEITYTFTTEGIAKFENGEIIGISEGETELIVAIAEAPEINQRLRIAIGPSYMLEVHYAIKGNQVIKEGGLPYDYEVFRTDNGQIDPGARFIFRLQGHHGLATLETTGLTTCRLTTNCKQRFGDLVLIADNLERLELPITVESLLTGEKNGNNK